MCSLFYGERLGSGAQFFGSNSSILAIGVESRRIRTSVRYARGSTPQASQVATTV